MDAKAQIPSRIARCTGCSAVIGAWGGSFEALELGVLRTDALQGHPTRRATQSPTSAAAANRKSGRECNNRPVGATNSATNGPVSATASPTVSAINTALGGAGGNATGGAGGYAMAAGDAATSTATSMSSGGSTSCRTIAR